MRRRLQIALLALFTTCAASTSAQAGPDPFSALESADPMEAARLLDRLGDDALLARLSADRPRAVQLGAVRAAPSLAWPEIALPRLAELAAGRDPALAPAAARSLYDIARALDPDALAVREVDPASLAPVRRRLSALSADATARADLRAAAAVADASLEAAGVP